MLIVPSHLFSDALTLRIIMNPISPTSSRSSQRPASSVLLRALLCSAVITVPSCGKEGAATNGSTATAAASAEASEAPLDHAAHPGEAMQKLDLTTFPVMDGASDTRQRTMTTLSYQVPSDVKTAFTFQQKNLLSRKWTELPGGTVTDQYSSGTFSRAGFYASVMISPSSAAGKVDVIVILHGNVDLAKIPVPAGATKVYVGPLTAMYTVETSPADTATACEKLLLAEGWEPYGTLADAHHYRKNAMLLKVSASAAPAQGGKTMISLLTELMCAEIPMMPGAEDFRYADITGRFDFDTSESEEAVTAYYRKALTAMGWEATMDKTIEIDGKDMVIFRNPAKDMVTLEMKVVSGKTRTSLLHQSAAQVEELDRQVKAQGERIKKKLAEEKNRPTPKLKLTLPVGALEPQATKNTLKFTTANGQGKSTVEAMAKQLTGTGWKQDHATLEPLAGMVSLSLESAQQSLNISYTDTGFTPVEVQVTLIGADLELAR